MLTNIIMHLCLQDAVTRVMRLLKVVAIIEESSRDRLGTLADSLDTNPAVIGDKIQPSNIAR